MGSGGILGSRDLCGQGKITPSRPQDEVILQWREVLVQVHDRAQLESRRAEKADAKVSSVPFAQYHDSIIDFTRVRVADVDDLGIGECETMD